MGALQYMVMGYESDHFKDEILPELDYLSQKGIIRVVDLLIVERDARGVVTSHELSEVMPDQAKLVSGSHESSIDWFAQDDVNVVGEYLADNSAVALLLLEHTWAVRLEKAARKVNEGLVERGLPPESLMSEIEQFLSTGAGAGVR
jgi:hypothetical protein